MRRGLNILHGASKQEIEDLFSTSSEVEKMDGMVQTLQIMVGAIEARKAVVAEREAARLAAAAAPTVQSELSAFLPAPTPSVQVTSISQDESIQVEEAPPTKSVAYPDPHPLMASRPHAAKTLLEPTVLQRSFCVGAARCIDVARLELVRLCGFFS